MRLDERHQPAGPARFAVATVRGSSMLPTLPAGSRVLVDRGGAPADVQPGDLVALRGPRGDGVAHRVVARMAGGFLTQGDNRPTPDGLAPMDGIEGRALFVRHEGGGWRRPPRVPAGRFWRSRPGRRVLRLYLGTHHCLTWILSNMDRFETQRIGKELAVHDRSSGQVHLLNSTAALVWIALREGSGREGVAARLAARHPEIPAGQIKADVDGVIEDLLNRKLLETDDKERLSR